MEEKDSFSCYETVKDRNGKKHKIYSVMVNDRFTVAKFMETYNPDLLFMRFIQPVIDSDGIEEIDANGDPVYDSEPVDDLLEIIDLALDKRESREEILKWLDIDTANEIIFRFARMSQLKKKLT